MRHVLTPLTAIALFMVSLAATWSAAGELQYKERLLGELVKTVPQILRRYDAATGRFNDGLWNCQDQNRMYPLAAAYATPGPGNRYYKSPELLAVIVKAGQALIDDADAQGRWVFRKKDGSTWGMIRMPWTYSRWMRTFALIRDDMPPEARAAWSKALVLGYTGVSRDELKTTHNIATHHAMGLYVAGQALQRPEWCRQAADFLAKIAAQQAEGGYWSEGGGPVVEYNFVYLEALGVYYAMSHDDRVLPALQKAADYHAHLTYPDGRPVETVDQRNPYTPTVTLGNVGFTFSPAGRAWLKRQWAVRPFSTYEADLLASFLINGQEGATADPPPAAQRSLFTLHDGGLPRAAVVREGAWFLCLSAYTAPLTQVRWHQDRQNLVSIFHDQTGLILGGGNTKLQPAWSNFTVGDVGLLVHQPGDINPNFLPPAGKLFHVPSAATLVTDPELGLDLTYGPEQCRIRLRSLEARSLVYHLEATANSGLPVAAHLTLLPRLDKPLQTASGTTVAIAATPLDLTAAQLGGGLTYAGYRLTLPATATLHWPRLPHNPYTKDGHAAPSEGRIEITVPFDAKQQACDVRLEVVP